MIFYHLTETVYTLSPNTAEYVSISVPFSLPWIIFSGILRGAAYM